MKHCLEVKDYNYLATLILSAFIFQQSGRKSIKADEYLVSNMGVKQPTFIKAYFSETATFQNGKMTT